jgi:hypothetical protein
MKTVFLTIGVSTVLVFGLPYAMVVRGLFLTVIGAF